jgi:hypothetical protein
MIVLGSSLHVDLVERSSPACLSETAATPGVYIPMLVVLEDELLDGASPRADPVCYAASVPCSSSGADDERTPYSALSAYTELSVADGLVICCEVQGRIVSACGRETVVQRKRRCVHRQCSDCLAC